LTGGDQCNALEQPASGAALERNIKTLLQIVRT
jgi:hypothetical protein